MEQTIRPGLAEQTTALRASLRQTLEPPPILAHAQASTEALPPFSMLVDPTGAALRWRPWSSCQQNYFRATRPEKQMGLFQQLPEREDDADSEVAVRTINKHFDPQLNLNYE